ncbi:recombinase family protein [Staphylococcus delphini]|uniref:recombinase family protein n=1 Tax=Staphylococcus delphini TaxID=53344 RepID=UPI000BBC2A2E|nr:recombinase family protein [Staphylococcus delphini]PCF82836.1 Pin-related site-specific recombinase/DNA invertase [Staphylococcus delphini]
MSRIGYSRVSTKSQNLNRQIELLANCDKIFADKISGNELNRPELKAMLSYLREGDIVVVTELDRLGRNNEDLTQIMDTIQKKGATLEILNLPSLKGIEDDNLRKLINNLIIELYKYQAESERKRIRERQAQGIALAKKQGKYKGRKPKFTENDMQLNHAFDLYRQGKTDMDIERLTGINRRTFKRYREKFQITR